jgi:hypothetical protein
MLIIRPLLEFPVRQPEVARRFNFDKNQALVDVGWKSFAVILPQFVALVSLSSFVVGLIKLELNLKPDQVSRSCVILTLTHHKTMRHHALTLFFHIVQYLNHQNFFFCTKNMFH